MSSQQVCEFMSENIRENKIKTNKLFNIVAYPQNNVREIAQIMSDIKIECLPIFSSPWNKKIIGFIELNKIKVFLKD
jgi:predicted transcriptional regulator